jgi:hypothetical protein
LDGCEAFEESLDPSVNRPIKLVVIVIIVILRLMRRWLLFFRGASSVYSTAAEIVLLIFWCYSACGYRICTGDTYTEYTRWIGAYRVVM